MGIPMALLPRLRARRWRRRRPLGKASYLAMHSDRVGDNRRAIGLLREALELSATAILSPWHSFGWTPRAIRFGKIQGSKNSSVHPPNRG